MEKRKVTKIIEENSANKIIFTAEIALRSEDQNAANLLSNAECFAFHCSLS
ncbi:hypothetical protein WN55_02921 [Dufourea novaeangliae]|uniref:Uncharacterized protein n=1 Tax=Dufourea novaeangliae TaxID=178035 RepID=A0A154PIG9_DUFNO|nr:hypothetical protein WN55_02921 [Dufourea novaeangliae]